MNYFAFGLTIETDIDFDGVLQPSTAAADVSIGEGKVPEKAGQLTRIDRRGVRARFGKTANGSVLNWPGIGKFRVTEGNRITFQNLGADEGTLRLFLLSEVMGILLYQRGYFLLHASAVQINKQAHVFMGIPGAGKSTTATAFGKAGQVVLTDDLVAIKFVADKPYVIPAFSQYKVWQQTLTGLNIDCLPLEPSFEGATKFLVKQPLASFPTEPVLLRQLTVIFPPASRQKEGPVSPARVPVELLKHFPIPVQLLTSTYLQRHFRQSLQLAQSVPVHFMKRTANFQALELFVQHVVAAG